MKNLMLSVLLFLTFASHAATANVPSEIQKAYDTIIAATEEGNLAKFESVCDEKMKEAMTQENIDQIGKQITPAMRKGHQSIFLGMLDKGDYKTYLWKIDFKAEGVPDVLAKLTSKHGSGTVAGFYFE